MTIKTLPKVTVKNFKPFASLDGGGFNCTVYLDGKRFAVAHDSGQGGCIMYQPVTVKAGAGHKMHDTMQEITEYLKTAPEGKYNNPKYTFRKDFDTLVNEAIGAIEKEKDKKKITKKFKTHVVFAKGENTRSYAWYGPCNGSEGIAKGKEKIKKEHPNAIFLDEGNNLDKFMESTHSET